MLCHIRDGAVNNVHASCLIGGTASRRVLQSLIQGKRQQRKPVKNTSSKPKASKPKKSFNLPSGIIKISKPLTKGAGVKAVQEALAAVYFYPEKGAKNNGIDGYYGPKTANAVKRFQMMHGLSADGIYGPKTKAVLQKALK